MTRTAAASPAVYREHPIKILRYSAKNLWLLIFPLLRSLRFYPFSFQNLIDWGAGVWFDLLVALLPASALAIQTELTNGPITRAQAALAVAETYGWTETPFVDIDGCSDLQKEAITALYAAGIVSGTDATHFTPV